MTNIDPRLAAALAAQQNGGIMRVPSQAERDEVDLVRGLQIRTQAADMATKLLAGKAPNPTTWLLRAKMIEDYIRGGASDGPAHPRLRPDGPAS